jgi:hypothetical protein
MTNSRVGANSQSPAFREGGGGAGRQGGRPLVVAVVTS